MESPGMGLRYYTLAQWAMRYSFALVVLGAIMMFTGHFDSSFVPLCGFFSGVVATVVVGKGVDNAIEKWKADSKQA